MLRTWFFPTLFPRDKDVSDGSMRADMWAAGNSSAELFPGSVPPSRTASLLPAQQEKEKPTGTILLGPSHWGWATWGEQGVEKLARTMLEGRTS